MALKEKIKLYELPDEDVLTIVEDEEYRYKIGENPDDIDFAEVEEKSVWDKSVKVEENGYYWNKTPIILKGKLPNNTKPLVVELSCRCGGTSLGF